VLKENTYVHAAMERRRPDSAGVANHEHEHITDCP